MVGFGIRRRSRLRGNINTIVLLSTFSKLAFFGLIAAVVAIPLLFFWYGRDLPTPGTLVVSKFKDATRIYDRNGELLYSVYQDQNRTYVALSEIPKELRDATIAIEDEEFYKNKGFSVTGYLRAIRNIIFLKGLSGGSTITQQLVKNVLLTSERSIPRKIKELILSIQVDRKYSKDQIFEMYMNNIPYGGTAIGVEAGAQTYFGKRVQELDLAESAFLAGLPQSPSVYSPFSGNKYYIGRTDSVLKQMVANHYITKDQKEKALKKIENYTFAQKSGNIKAPHFVMYVREVLAKKFGDEVVQSGGLQVTTTLDYKLQKQAEEIVKEEVEKLEQYKVSNGAALIANPKTGEILAMVGSKDYFDEKQEGNFNAVFGKRQPGSSLKPIIYARAFEKGYTPSTLLMDVKTQFPVDDPQNPIYTPLNYNGKFIGPIQLRFALGNSINVPAVKLLSLVGIQEAMQKGFEMGITNWEPTTENLQNVGLSLVLGGREVTLFDEVTAYGVFANGGIKQEFNPILKVTDSKGKKLFEYKKKSGTRVLSEEVSFLISHILLDDNARSEVFGRGSKLNISGKTVSVKTGTTDVKRDNWTVGYTKSFVAGVWVGNNDNTPMNPKIASGVTGATPIWNRLMKLVLQDKPDEPLEKPEKVIAMQVDAFAGGLPVSGQPTRAEYFIKGTEPVAQSSIYTGEYFVFRENDPVSKDGINRWQQGIDAWINEFHKDDPKYHAPDDVLNPKPTATPEPTATPGPTATPTPSPSATPTPTPAP
ncbi:MAG: penicillin-binding protein [Candidatus Levybacteria bacterium]|nr:penicillin-binding protein [Candidatus Levybacteria bacterium]